MKDKDRFNLPRRYDIFLSEYAVDASLVSLDATYNWKSTFRAKDTLSRVRSNKTIKIGKCLALPVVDGCFKGL